MGEALQADPETGPPPQAQALEGTPVVVALAIFGTAAFLFALAIVAGAFIASSHEITPIDVALAEAEAEHTERVAQFTFAAALDLDAELRALTDAWPRPE